MKGFCPLASGSKGNAIFFGSKERRILIDAGISTRRLEKDLRSIDVEPDTIDAILVTHEHIDHIQGLLPFTQKYKVPVFANAETAKAIVSILGARPLFKIFVSEEPFSFGDLLIEPFSVPHDTLDPVGFTIQVENIKVGFCADLGHVTSLVKKKLENADYLYLEANHEPSMVHACPRPHLYKQRVLGKQGHLSNEQCKDLLIALMNPKLKHVHLAHLSSECNSEELVLKIVGETIRKYNHPTQFSIAHQASVSKQILF